MLTDGRTDRQTDRQTDGQTDGHHQSISRNCFAIRPKNLPHNQKVVFDKIHLNEGNAYDPKTGIFTCKEPGIYVFDWTIMTHPGYQFNTDLVVDGEVRGRLHLDARSIKSYRSGSNMVVAKLKPGNKVWVEPHSTDVGQHAHGKWSFFSGFKI